ncbi:hypothetical protein FHR75_003869 [Kineococcus radiotolerans]|uniref:Uncharacterized protein n=1 Tax=Kineococcus radiotolerans TaxID=131568 RepID=A0A7W4XYH4_KINRA|nr:hypothetical protein [Kineococcus radiotolerans]MBB2903033.1 hypothetical protein [Kineococcus radiotolerans]
MNADLSEDDRSVTGPGENRPTAGDEDWARRVRAGLLRDDVPQVLADAVLEQARAACRDSGRPATEVFGAPSEYVRQRPQESLDPELRARYDRDGVPEGFDASAVVLRLGVVGLAISIGTTAREGWTAEHGYAHAALLAAVLATFLLGGEALRRRGAGRLRSSRSAWVGSAAVAVAGLGAAWALRDDPARVDVPMSAPLLACVAIVAAGVLLRRRRPAAGTAGVPDDTTPDEWFTRLEHLLRGRHLMAPARTRWEVDEARAFWRAGGTEHPQVEFGTPQAYAVVLTDGDDAPRRRRAAWRAAAATLFGVLALTNLARSLIDGETGGWWRTVVALLLCGAAVASWVRLARARAPRP